MEGPEPKAVVAAPASSNDRNKRSAADRIAAETKHEFNNRREDSDTEKEGGFSAIRCHRQDGFGQENVQPTDKA